MLSEEEIIIIGGVGGGKCQVFIKMVFKFQGLICFWDIVKYYSMWVLVVFLVVLDLY